MSAHLIESSRAAPRNSRAPYPTTTELLLLLLLETSLGPAPRHLHVPERDAKARGA